ncbi:MAG: lysophospholipid acyltransferase family protein [Actinomycetota bacterium]
MADAEIIPIGTRGRPGRGSGSARPSAAARSLAAGGAKTTRKGKPAAPAEVEDRSAAEDAAAAPSDPGTTGIGSRVAGGRRGASKRAASATAAKPAAKPAASTAADTTTPGERQVDERPATGSRDTGRRPADAAAQSGGTGVAGQDEAVTASGAGSEAAASPTTPRVTAQDRALADGIPVGDWLAAFSVAAKEIFGESWEPRLAEFLAFLRRRVTGDYSVDEYGFDAEVTERFFYAAIRPIAEKWFRVEVRGAENIPAEGGALLVSNHSGTVPVDGLVTGVSVHDHTGRHLRPLGADLVFRLPIVGEIARKGGATLACNEDAERMLRGGELVGVWPEGFKGIGKPYSDRYKLQRFGRGGFVSAALRTQVPIIPCSVVGAEEIYPLVGNLPSLARLLGVPYIPITPFFPLLGPLGLVPLPSKWLIEFGEPIRTDAYDDGAADDPMLVFNVTDQVRETIQQTLYSLLMQRRSVFH